MFDANGCDQFARRTKGDHFAVVHDGHAVAEPFGFVHIVRRQQNGTAHALELFDQIPKLAARLRIEAGGGFVEKQQIGIADQRAGQREPLFLSAGKVADARFLFIFQLHQRDDFRGIRSLMIEAAEQANGFEDGELFRKLGFLQLNSEPLPKFFAASVSQRSPSTSTSPESGVFRPSQISMVVVLPAPFGPRSPKHSPDRTSRSRPSTATTSL